MTEPVPGEPAWLPDPTGRHQHRWYDGTRFTDRVADDGATAIDPGPPVVAAPPAAPPFAPTPSMPSTSAWGSAWPGPSVPSPPASAPRRSRLPVVLGLVGTLLVLGGGVVVVLSRGGGDGAGTFTGTIDDDETLGTHDVSLAAGDALLVTLEPGGDLDAVLGVLVGDDDADALEDTFEDVVALDRQPPGDGFEVGTGDLDDGLQLLLRTDIGFAGESELLLLPVADDLDATVVVGPFEPGVDEDDYEITIQVVALDVDDDADGEDLLQAVEDDVEVPSDFRDLAEELLEEG